MYSVGNEKLLEGIKKFHLSGVGDRGIIRFISGSWGSGKTHFFRQLRDLAFDENVLVSSVELNATDTALNKFERVFYAIVRNVATPSYFLDSELAEIAPFGRVLAESLFFLGTGDRSVRDEVPFDCYERAKQSLMIDRGIDIDFKKMVDHYWATFLPESAEPALREQVREEILQWFSGEGSIGNYRKRFGVGKMVSKENAKLMLQSLAGFVRLSGYKGLLILFDEAEQAYSIMRRSALKDAHNNLLSLINNIEEIPGLFLLYATTPDFYTDPKHGIVIYGALSGRIGKPDGKPPRALDRVWDFDAVSPALDTYTTAAEKIRAVYACAYPEAESVLPSPDKIREFVSELSQQHSAMSAVRFWRVLVAALVSDWDDSLEGKKRRTDEVYVDVMDRLREV